MLHLLPFWLKLKIIFPPTHQGKGTELEKAGQQTRRWTQIDDQAFKYKGTRSTGDNNSDLLKVKGS
jgi:hypothetical protein